MRGGCYISSVRNARDARRYRQAMNRRGRARLDDSDFHATFASSRSRQGAFARHCDGRIGCGVPRVAVCKATPGGSGNPPSATTSGREVLADGEAYFASSRAGPGQQPPRWSAERRAFPLERKARYAPAGLRHWPAEGCRCTRAPVGAPLPSSSGEGKQQTSEDKCLARTTMLA